MTGCKTEDTRDEDGARTAAGGGSQSGSQAQASTVPKLWHHEPPSSAMGIAWKQAIADFEKLTPKSR